MPTERERDYYRMGFYDGIDFERSGESSSPRVQQAVMKGRSITSEFLIKPKRKRTLSAWNKFVKANSNKKKFQYANGKLKLKKMGIAYRKKKR